MECTPFPFCRLTPSPQNTPTPTFAPTPTPTPTPMPIPTPTQTPRAIPISQTQPINVASPATTAITNTPTPITPTTTPAVATTTPVPATPSSASVTPADTSHVNLQPQDTKEKGGINIIMLSLGIGTPVLLVGGGLLLLIWRRQSKQSTPAFQRTFGNVQTYPMQSTFPDAQTYPMQSTFPDAQTYPMQSAFPNAQTYPMQSAFPNAQPALQTNTYEMTANVSMPPYAPPITPTPSASGALPMLGGAQAMPFPQSAYIPSDLRPITAAFPQQLLTAASNNAVSPVLNGDLQPLPMENLSLQPNQNQPLLAQSRANMETPIPSSPSLLPAWMQGPISPPQSLFPTPSLAIQPPSLKEDPILEKVMQHAQMGLFVVLGRENSK